MKILVTGVAGFIGSSLAARLLRDGHTVQGIDCFTDYYARSLKQENIKELSRHPSFSFVEGDLTVESLTPLFAGVEACFHQAAQAGVRSSWGGTFDIYLRQNILVTQRILECLKSYPHIKLIFASTSSVYGDCPLPMHEEQLLRPVSPYGVTKLAAENLCYLYRKNFGLSYTAFRYFTVYGPKQRPDMAFHKFIRALLLGEEIKIYGDGEQTRDFTYIDDVLAANLAALTSPATGEVFNLGGGSRISIRQVIPLLEEITGKKAKISFGVPQKGDSLHTFADTSKARQLLGFRPAVDLKTGLTAQVRWMEESLKGGFLCKTGIV